MSAPSNPHHLIRNGKAKKLPTAALHQSLKKKKSKLEHADKQQQQQQQNGAA